MRQRSGLVSALTALALLGGAVSSEAAIVPVPECRVASNPSANTWWIYYGYVNNGADQNIDFGGMNQVIPGFGFQGQPTIFNSGSYPRVFRAAFNAAVFSAIAWELDGLQGIATLASTPVCTSGATGPASELAPDSARLHGLLEPENTNTAYYFDYGPTIAYGGHTVERQVTGARGRLVDEPITGLAPGATYHYRLVSSGAVTTVGEDSTFTTPPVPNPPTDLTLAQSSTPEAVRTGERVTSVLTAKNAGAVDATGVQIVDALPGGAEFDAAASGAPCSAVESTVTCTVGALAAGAESAVTVAWIPRRAGTATNGAIVAADQPDPAALNNRADSAVAVTAPDTTPGPPPVVDPPATPLADLVLKRSAPRTARKGKRANLVLTVLNRGPVTASDVVLVQRLPSGLRLVSAAWPGGGKCSGRTRLTCRVGSIAPGTRVKVTVKVLARRSGRFGDTANVSGGQPDPSASNNVAVGTLRVR